MARLIDADALLLEIEEELSHESLFFTTEQNKLIDIGLRIASGDIRHQPTVDAVEVVRCRDCKWYMPGDLFTDIMFCHRLKKENGKPAKYNFCEDDFCSYGERKDGDGNG